MLDSYVFCQKSAKEIVSLMFIRVHFTIFPLMSRSRSIQETVSYPVDVDPFGISYGKWTVEWWRWFLSTPKSHILNDKNFGELAYTNNVWFLTGKVGDESESIPTFSCTIPASYSVLFPVINCEVNVLERPDLNTDRDMIEYIDRDQNSIIFRRCWVNGEEIAAQRVKSDPLLFEVYLSGESYFGSNGEGNTIATADGYWVFLKPLRRGSHIVTFRGACEKGRLKTGAKYQLNIQ